MRLTRILCALMAVSFAFSLMAKEPKDKNKYGVYLAGVSASFKDSLVYFTGVQFVDSAAITGKNFLVERAQFSEQLHDYMESAKGMKDRTCFIFFDKKKKNLEKELHKLRQKYEKGGNMLIMEMDTAFTFKKPIEY